MPPTSFDHGVRRPTIRDIAELAGVSVATVSRVLNNGPGVSPGTRAMVLESMERNSFTRWRRPRRPAQVPCLVAVRCPYELDEYFGLVVSVVARSLRQHGRRLVLSAEAEDGAEPSLPELLLADMTEGAILVLPPEPTEVLRALKASEYPFVLIDPRVTPPADVASVSVAHMAGARAATQHLIELGHSRIAMISGPTGQLSSDARVLGYRAALAASGRLAPPEYVPSVREPDVVHGMGAAEALLDLAEPPTAIVAFNDKMAVGAMRAAAHRGLDVPGDLSVIGFDALELSRLVQPALTTVRQPIEEMARMGVELLIRLINGREIEALHVELAADLVLGASTAPPRN